MGSTAVGATSPLHGEDAVELSAVSSSPAQESMDSSAITEGADGANGADGMEGTVVLCPGPVVALADHAPSTRGRRRSGEGMLAIIDAGAAPQKRLLGSGDSPRCSLRGEGEWGLDSEGSGEGITSGGHCQTLTDGGSPALSGIVAGKPAPQVSCPEWIGVPALRNRSSARLEMSAGDASSGGERIASSTDTSPSSSTGTLFG